MTDPIALTPGILLDAFKAAHRKGVITSTKPMKARQLVVALRQYRNASTSIDGREIREMINALVDRGETICSTNRGYYYAATADEIQPAIDYLNSYISELSKRVAGLRKSQRALAAPQPELFEKVGV